MSATTGEAALDDAPAISASAEIERSLVAGLMFHPDRIAEVAAMVQPAHFGDFEARVLYACMRDMAALGKPVDFILVREELKRRKEFEAVGGLASLNGLLHLAGDDGNLVAYAGKIAEAAAANERLGAVAQAYGDLVQEGKESAAVCSDLVARLQQIDRGDLQRREALTAREILRECLDPGNRAAFVSTGFESIDSVHGGGLAIPSLTVIGAAPSIGKTQLANNLAARMRKGGNPARVLYLSLEMGKSEMACRFIAMLGALDLGVVKAIQYGRAGEHTERMHGGAFDRGAENFAALPLLMFTGSLDADGVRDFAARYSGRYDVLILDYLQRVGGQKNQKALGRVEAASRACKDIAVQHDVAVVALASLSREGYRDTSVKPDLAHLRECGTIEFDTDNAWLLWRDKNDMPTREILELHVRKQRNGPLDTLTLDFNLHTGRISERREEVF